MRFKEYLHESLQNINELSLVKKEQIYMHSLIKLGSVGKKNKIALDAFNFFKIPQDGEVIFYGFNTKDKVNKTYTSNRKADSCKIGYNGKIFEVLISSKSFQGWWSGVGGGKSDTRNTTELKETISMWLCNNPRMSENDIMSKVNKELPELARLYTKLYYTSGLAHAELFSKFGLNSSMLLELQGGEYSSVIYDWAKNLSGISSPDNWNPGDMWAFSKKGISLLKLSNPNTLFELNDLLKSSFESKDIVGISLKQINKGKGTTTIVDPLNRGVIPYKMEIVDIDISKSFKSIFFNTSSGFALKGNMRGSATSLNLNFETYMKGKGYSNGAVPSFLWDKQKKNFAGVVYSGESTPEVTSNDFEKARIVFKKYKSYIKNNLDYILNVSISELEPRDRKRYIINASHLNFVMNTDDIIEFSYYAAMKLHDEASIYLKFAG